MNEKSITCHDCHVLNGKKIIYLFYFDYFSLQYYALFGSLDCIAPIMILVIYHIFGEKWVTLSVLSPKYHLLVLDCVMV